jgi:hypothetical protein
VVIVVSLFSSCAGETNIIDGNNNKLLSFLVSVPSWKSNDSISSSKDSRATPITDTSLGTDKTFGIIADILDGSNYTTEINQEVVSYNTTNKIWETVADHYWPGVNKTVNFYAYSPASITNGTLNHTAGSAPTLTYTVPDDATNQEDIMISTSTDISGTTYSSTSISFKHILAAIKFSVGTSGMPSGTITKITLNNIQYTGTYLFDGIWTPNTTDLHSFSQIVSASSNAGTVITSDETTFMMMPQTLNSSASITVTYSNGGTLTKVISGTWTAGNTYTYNVSKTIPVANFDYTGDVQSYTVPLTGTYKLEVWGAQGNSSYGGTGGLGGYSYGEIKLVQGSTLYICVGQCNPTVNDNPGVGAYNGGGIGSGSGGGATHIATISGVLSSLNSNKSSVIIVAGGGGGGDAAIGGAGGGLSGGTGGFVTNVVQLAAGGSQTTGGLYGYYSINGTGTSGSFGQGGEGGPGTDGNHAGGGGGGWYGGGGINYGGGGGGGSGHIGTGVTGETIAGSQTIIAPGGGTETGHSGNGYARITFVSAD